MWDVILEDILPNALMIGVDYELFWTLNPKSLAPFVKAFELKEKHSDTMAWLSGLYVRSAIVSAMNKDAKYPTHPISDNVKKRDLTPEDRMNIIKDRFLANVELINSNIESKQGE